MAWPRQDTAEQTIGRRSNARLRLHLPATLVLLRGEARGHLLDLSRTGARVELNAPCLVEFAPCEGAVLQGAGIDEFADVIWKRGRMCGLRFEVPLPQARLLAVRAYAAEFPSLERERQRSEVREWVNGQVRRM